MMSLPALLTAYAEFIGDVMVNEWGYDPPDRVLRYHGLLPDDCCTPGGTLAVWWSDGVPTKAFPANAGGSSDTLCGLIPRYMLHARWVTCWPVSEADENGVRLIDPTWDGEAARLAGVADGVTRSLISLACAIDQSKKLTEAGAAVLAQLARKSFRYVDTSPSLPLGGCAGVEWRCYAAPVAAAPVS